MKSMFHNHNSLSLHIQTRLQLAGIYSSNLENVIRLFDFFWRGFLYVVQTPLELKTSFPDLLNNGLQMCTTAVLDLSSTLNIANHCDLKALEKAVKVPWSFLDSNIQPKSMLTHSS